MVNMAKQKAGVDPLVPLRSLVSWLEQGPLAVLTQVASGIPEPDERERSPGPGPSILPILVASVIICKLKMFFKSMGLQISIGALI